MPDPDSTVASTGRPLGIPGSAVFALIGLGRRSREEVEARLETRGLTLRHLAALGHLSRGPASYSELARRSRVTAQSMQGTVAALEASGAVERRSRPGRGRTADLRVTDAGRALLADGQETMGSVEDLLLGGLAVEERQVLTGLLMQVTVGAFEAPGDRPPTATADRRSVAEPTFRPSS